MLTLRMLQVLLALVALGFGCGEETTIGAGGPEFEGAPEFYGAAPEGDRDDATSGRCEERPLEAAPTLSLVRGELWGTMERSVFTSDSRFGVETRAATFDTELQVLRNDEVIWERVGVGSQVAIEDGAFADPATTSLSQWKRYAVRGRLFDGECARSSWSNELDFRSDDGSHALFNGLEPLRVELTLSDASYDAIAAEAKPEGARYPYTRFYYSVDVKLDGQSFAGAGGRVKGSGTARALSAKAALKIHLGWDDPDIAGCAVERRFRGLKRITLNNMAQDPTYIRETLGYQFYEALGLPVPRTQFANVTLNGVHMGFYLHVESVDRRFLARRFSSHRGMLYEAIYGGGRDCDISPEKLGASAEQSCFEASFSTDECDGERKNFDATDHSHLQLLGEQIAAIPPGELYESLGAFFNVEGYLYHFAAEIVVGAGDSHFYHWNNYRLYHEPTQDLWHTIPTGIDSSFSTWLPPGAEQESPVAYLAQRCLEEKTCRERLIEIVETALDTFDSMAFPDRMDALSARIEENVAQDTRGESSAAEINRARQSMRRYTENRRGFVESLLGSWRAL